MNTKKQIMKNSLFIFFLYILSSCSQGKVDQITNDRKDSTFIFTKSTEWSRLQKSITPDIRAKIVSNLSDTSKEFIAEFFKSGNLFFPQIDELITISFNKNDSFMLYEFETSSITFKKKTIIPHKQQRTFWIDKNFNLIDTLFNRINSCDFWEQPSEIKLFERSDGRDYCILIKDKSKFHYVLRCCPDYDGYNDSVFQHRKEFMKLCDYFVNIGKIGYINNWYYIEEDTKL